MDSFPETYVDPNYDSAPSIPKVKRNCLPARSWRNCSLFQGFVQDRSNNLAACQLPMRSKERTGKIDSAARTGGRNLRPVGGGGGTPHMKGTGMLVVSLRGVNFGFWSHLGCSGENAIIFSREGVV